MLATFNVNLTKEDYVVGLQRLMEQLGKNDPHRDFRIFEQLGVVTILILVLTFTFRDAAWAVIVAIFAVSVAQSALGHRWAIKSTGASFDPDTADCTVQFSDSEIVEQCGTRERRWQWSAIRGVHDCGSAVVFEISGWDMLILPSRLWPDEAQRRAFLAQARSRIDRPGTSVEPKAISAPPEAHAILLLGAIAAAVDTFFLLTWGIPPNTNGDKAAAVLVALPIAAGGAYLAYRFARYLLEGLYPSSPVLTQVIAHVLILAVPAYIAASYFGLV